MSALLRYAILKSRRDGTLAALLLAPSVMIGAPTLIGILIQIVRGEATYPIAIRAGQLDGPAVFGPALVVIAATIAGVAGFWSFRGEAASRSAGFFFLARRPAEVSVAAAVFGTAAAICSYGIGLLTIAAFCAALPPRVGSQFVALLVASCVAAALGAAAVAISSEVTMLVPVYIAAVAVAVVFVRSFDPRSLGVAAVVVALLMILTPLLWRYRCAA